MKVIISGGGTGGHIFPAIAIADALKAKCPEIELLFIGAEDRMEMEKVPAAGYKIIGLWISGLQRNLSLRNLIFPFKVAHSLIKAGSVIRAFKPDVVVGVGGYASGPMLRVAAKRGVPTLIQEQNSYAGLTNRILGKKVDVICVAYEGMNKFFPKDKLKFTGNPVRKDIISLTGKKEAAMSYFSLNPSKKTVLVIGGSLGARSINTGISSCISQLLNIQVQLIWQTGKAFFREAEKIANEEKNNGAVKVFEFISKMDLAYAVADIIISRAGAIAVSELCCVGKPVILVPSPNVAEDHQTKNATTLLDKDAAIIMKDHETGTKLRPVISALLADEHRMAVLGANINKLAKYHAAEEIAAEILKLAEKK